MAKFNLLEKIRFDCFVVENEFVLKQIKAFKIYNFSFNKPLGYKTLSIILQVFNALC